MTAGDACAPCNTMRMPIVVYVQPRLIYVMAPDKTLYIGEKKRAGLILWVFIIRARIYIMIYPPGGAGGAYISTPKYLAL